MNSKSDEYSHLAYNGRWSEQVYFKSKRKNINLVEKYVLPVWFYKNTII